METFKAEICSNNPVLSRTLHEITKLTAEKLGFKQCLQNIVKQKRLDRKLKKKKNFKILQQILFPEEIKNLKPGYFKPEIEYSAKFSNILLKTHSNTFQKYFGIRKGFSFKKSKNLPLILSRKMK